MNFTTSSRVLALGLVLLVCQPAWAVFDIELNYITPVNPSAAERDAFEGAAEMWESIITGYVDDNNTASNAPLNFDGPRIDVRISPNDGPGGTLGFAQPLSPLRLNAMGNPYTYATRGSMTFDSDDFGTGSIFDAEILKLIVAHEMGHVLGIGTLWAPNGLYQQFTRPGEYLGEYGNAAYREEFDPTADFLPVELGGAAGTAHKHWDEPDNGAAFTGLLDDQNRDFTYELMTGWFNFIRYDPYISRTTIASLRDLGYTVQPVPEPSSVVLALLGGLGWVAVRRRR